MKKSAHFSEDRKYRYTLARIWDENKPFVLFCMLNPSTADENANDPTVERCQRRAKSMGFGGLIVVNIFAYRSTDPEELYKAKAPIGMDNTRIVLDLAQHAGMVICGWGKHGNFRDHGKYMLMRLRQRGVTPYALKINKDGTPAHPLYIGYRVKPKPIDIEAP